MKKISRILSRRRPDDAADSDSERSRRRAGSPTATPPPAATGFHQLPFRRATGSEVALARTHRKLSAGVGGGCVVADGSRDAACARDDDAGQQSGRRGFLTKTCPRCVAADFPRLLDWKHGQPRPWVPLSHVLLPPPGLPPSPPSDGDSQRGLTPPGAPQCPFCVFFRAMIGPVPAVGDGTAKFHPYLRIRRAFERLDGVGERHELAGSVMIEVMTRKKSLPWGYLVKADEDEGWSRYVEAQGEASIRARVVSAMVDPALPRCWLDFCREKHAGTACMAPVKMVQGLRLVDCTEMRVVAAEEIQAHGQTDYLALSYVWAQTELDSSPDAPFDTSASSLGPDGRLPESVPLLFADAIAFTSSLGFRYIWIDRFCLPVPASERKKQVDAVGEIFSQSLLTLIVAAEDTSLGGIPGLSTPREEQLCLKTKTGLYATSLVRPDLEVASSQWASRAWTFQEGLLARRRLIFTPSQMYFQCRTLHCHESLSLPLRLAPSVSLGRVFPAGDGCPRQPGQFKDLIKTYMCRDLADNEGRLDALRALLREYARMGGLAVKHFLGLPLFHPDDFVTSRVVSETDRLAAGLGWICDWTGSVEPSCRRTASFPSWTWLAWNLREGLTAADSKFAFNLVGDVSPILHGVSAAPRMEISVGFKDAAVLSWEIDGDAISKKSEAIAFLRLETFSFDVAFTVEGAQAELGDVALTSENRTLVEAMITASLSGQEDGASGFACLGVLVSGRNWKGGTDCAATALICGRQTSGEDAGAWVRLGAVAIECEAFVDGPEEAVLKGVEVDEGQKKDLSVRLRELDLY
ncbi:Heterokaryon incompatibility [Metarhizium guizhouense ARSEF 977]|uniref:Heterokaryon incompatibility n=1 Tax=Metarhizium guizhouense (strain ARSEF 977) TaxID=1276136 RepID=A0A0B4GNV1_METGA|nr:Heterokaryon incompatibility [Metarhizium guizhouense ARSEF 977]